MSPDAVARPGRRPGDLRVVVGRAAKLPRTLGAPALFAASYGNVGSSIYYALGVTAAFALGLTPLALILAGLIFVSTALNYAEGSAALPHAGGSSQFARRAFNAPIGFLVGWVQLLNYTATVSISAYFAISYLGVFGKYFWLFGEFRSSEPWHIGATIVLIGLLLVVNVIGIQESSALNLVLAMTDLVTQFALVILGLIFLLNIRTVINNVHLGVAPTWGNFLASISIAMVTYTGIETISNMSEEVKNPGRSVPRATFAVIAAVLFVSAFLPTIGMSVFPVHLVDGQYTTALATTYKSDPVAGIVTGFNTVSTTLAFWAGLWVGFLAFTILVIATNAGLIGISRLSYSLAGADLLPHRFARLHPKFKTPYISIMVFGIGAAVLVLPGIFVHGQEIDLLGSVYALAATFAFCSAHLSVMRLRFIEPNLYRPYRMPWNIRFGRDSIPVLSLLGALAIGTVFTQLMSQNISNSSYIYLGWLVPRRHHLCGLSPLPQAAALGATGGTASTGPRSGAPAGRTDAELGSLQAWEARGRACRGRSRPAPQTPPGLAAGIRAVLRPPRTGARHSDRPGVRGRQRPRDLRKPLEIRSVWIATELVAGPGAGGFHRRLSAQPQSRREINSRISPRAGIQLPVR